MAHLEVLRQVCSILHSEPKTLGRLAKRITQQAFAPLHLILLRRSSTEAQPITCIRSIPIAHRECGP
jgi:hypothetical protein